MTNHTPGPWHIQPGESSRVYLVNNDQGHAIGEIVHTDTRKPADARLIAAAPELLAALRDLLAATPQTYDNRHERAAALDAIEKATKGA